MNGRKGLVVEEGFLGTGELEVMKDIVFGFIRGETGHMETHGDSLAERLHDGEVHNPSEIGLTAEDEDKGVIGVHFKIGEKAEFFEGAGLEEMGLIDNEEDGFSGLFFGFQKGLLDLVVDGTFRKPGGQAQEPIDMIKEIGPGEGGKRGIKGFEEVFVEGIDEASHGQGFADPGITGEQQDAPSAFNVFQTGQAFF